MGLRWPTDPSATTSLQLTPSEEILTHTEIYICERCNSCRLHFNVLVTNCIFLLFPMGVYPIVWYRWIRNNVRITMIIILFSFRPVFSNYAENTQYSFDSYLNVVNDVIELSRDTVAGWSGPFTLTFCSFVSTRA